MSSGTTVHSISPASLMTAPLKVPMPEIRPRLKFIAAVSEKRYIVRSCIRTLKIRFSTCNRACNDPTGNSFHMRGICIPLPWMLSRKVTKSPTKSSRSSSVSNLNKSSAGIVPRASYQPAFAPQFDITSRTCGTQASLPAWSSRWSSSDRLGAA
jgi:hypothetical protein